MLRSATVGSVLADGLDLGRHKKSLNPSIPANRRSGAGTGRCLTPAMVMGSMVANPPGRSWCPTFSAALLRTTAATGNFDLSDSIADTRTVNLVTLERMPEPSTREILDFALALSIEAGRLIMPLWKKVAVDHKADGSEVTEADRGAEQLLRKRIAERYPDHQVLGEEFGGEEEKKEGSHSKICLTVSETL